MPMFINTRGKPSLAIGICDRCRLKMALSDMVSDPNSPGLRVHARCADGFDPYRLSMPSPEVIAVRFARPDASVAVENQVGIITEDGLSFLITEDGESWLVP